MHSDEKIIHLPWKTTARADQIPGWSAVELICLWVLVVVPMAALSLVAAPVLIARNPEMNPGLIFWATIIAGMFWQTVVSIGVLIVEGQVWTWPDLRQRLWLVTPRDPATGRTAWPVMWLLVLIGALFVFSNEVALGWLDDSIERYLPSWLSPGYGDIRLLSSPENTGNWILLAFALVSSLFNYVLGEAFFFHGILLPRMQGAFGRWAWVANAVAFGAYHVHKAAAWPTVTISCLAYSLPSQYLRSIWPALLIHGIEGFILIGAVLYVILGGMQ